MLCSHNADSLQGNRLLGQLQIHQYSELPCFSECFVQLSILFVGPLGAECIELLTFQVLSSMHAKAFYTLRFNGRHLSSRLNS